MDGTQHYPAAPAPLSQAPVRVQAHATAHGAAAANPSAAKAPSDYIRALRRRVWLVFMVGVPLSVAATVWVVRQPSVYRALAQISIEPPQYDSTLATLVSHEVGRQGSDASDRYMPNQIALLKSKSLAERVVNDPAFLQGNLPPDADAADELILNINTKVILGSNAVIVSLDGTDPAARTAKQLSTLLDTFYKMTKDEAEEKTESSHTYANESLAALDRELQDLDRQVLAILKKTKTIGPGGKNIIQAQYETLGTVLMQKRSRMDEIQQQAWLSQIFPKFREQRPGESARLDKIARLHDLREKLTMQLEEHRRIVKPHLFDYDPAVKYAATKLKNVLDQIRKLENAPSLPTEFATDPMETIVASAREEIHSIETAAKETLQQLRESMPEHQLFETLQEARELKLKQISEMRTKASTFDMLSKTQKPPVRLYGPVAEPTVPVRPRRALNIAAAIIVSFGLGIALVCFLEHLDHSVKVPEHLTVGLTLPLLGVVPRIRRTALTNRGGHLWTHNTPGSIEADAYRNVRASLLGASDRLGPIRTLLVTSAKAGEGKSTTALNLAATCARAGERTLLMDLDLRRPSLGEMFPRDESAEGPELGLVDVLRDELPWQRTVVRTDSPNLDFLPAGDTRDIPVEVLDTVEMRQLLIGLANHYDRIILDGPAVLGMADCRMIGRVVDAALLVVRSGSHEMRPLQRAKAMLEQSGVVLVGVVFNGLYEDLQNWSSYGPYEAYVPVEPRRGISRRDARETALPLAGTVEV